MRQYSAHSRGAKRAHFHQRRLEHHRHLVVKQFVLHLVVLFLFLVLDAGRRPTAPAIATGTVPLTASTSLVTLGIIAKGTITVADGSNTTTYASTGSDTVGDLLNAINKNAYGNAQVAAWLDSCGKLVISGKDDTSMITIGGTNAANVGLPPAIPFSANSARSQFVQQRTGGRPARKLVRELVFEHVKIVHQYGEQLKRWLFAQLGARPAKQQHRRNAAVQQRHKRQHRQLICLID